MVHKTLVHSLVEYSTHVWSAYTQNNIHKIEMIQHRAARWTLDIYSRQASVTEILNHLGWQRNYSRLCLFFKIIHGLLPWICHHMFSVQPVFPIRIHTHWFFIKSIYYKYLFYPLAIMKWNSLPSKIAFITAHFRAL